MPQPERTYRDWRPGDGVTCRYARNAPVELPCGKPVRVETRDQDGRPGKSIRQHSPLCANHADLGLPKPNEVLLEARRIATERLVMEHYETFRSYLTDAIADIRDRGGSTP